MKPISKTVAVCCVLLVILLLCWGYTKKSSNVSFETDVVPRAVENVINNYFLAAQGNDIERVLDVLFFLEENNFDRDAYCTNFKNGIKPVAAKIYSADKINDHLYAVSLAVEVSNTEEPGGIVYNYVAEINGTWRYILAKSNIPEDVLDNADLSAYSYSEDRYLGSEDIIK